jgi:predicted Zn finger-like uncharacterized protein
MIIQCDKCSAKFRFDDALMREEGVWVRCGLCRHEFFQSHPLASPGVLQAKVSVPDAGEIRIDRDVEMPNARSGAGILGEPDIRDDKAARSSDGTSTEKLLKVIHGKKRNGEPEAAAPEKVRSPSALRISACVLALLLVIAGMGFFVFPDVGRQAISDLSSWLPWGEKKQPPQLSIEDGIRVEAVSQRFVANISMGNLRVVEGVAVNQSGHPVARLWVKATLVDSQNNLLGEKRASAGNVLSDAELTALTEEEMNRRLANPEGSTAPNDRILTGGRIPFMIVWAFEPPGAVKTSVTVAGVERLLQ